MRVAYFSNFHRREGGGGNYKTIGGGFAHLVDPWGAGYSYKANERLGP